MNTKSTPTPNFPSLRDFDSIPRPEGLVTKRAIMAHFGMSERTVERYVEEYQMPKYMIGTRSMRFRISEIQTYLEQRGAKRFAAIGRANTLHAARKILIQLLPGLDITDTESTKRFPLPGAVETKSLADNNSQLGTGEGQSGSCSLGVSALPRAAEIQASRTARRIKPPRLPAGRKRKSPSTGKSPCRGSHHKWHHRQYTRTCSRCGLTEHRDPATGAWLG